MTSSEAVAVAEGDAVGVGANALSSSTDCFSPTSLIEDLTASAY